jgi:hypothetical protein
MCVVLRYCAGGLAAALAVVYVAVSAESGMSAFRPTVLEPESASMTIVNRAGKGDRELTIQEIGSSVTRRGPAPRSNPVRDLKAPKIPEGCDPAFSPLTSSAKSNFTNRCLV